MSKTIFKSKRQFGRINLEGTTTRRFYGVSIELTLNKESLPYSGTVDLQSASGPYVNVSITGSIGEVSGGQCQDTIRQFYPLCQPDDGNLEDLLRICALWDRWHLNGMNAGTSNQRACLAAAQAQFESLRKAGKLQDVPDHAEPWQLSSDGSHYTWVQEILEAAGLLYDRGYKYGSAWLVEIVPVGVLLELCSLFDRLAGTRHPPKSPLRDALADDCNPVYEQLGLGTLAEYEERHDIAASGEHEDLDTALQDLIDGVKEIKAE